MKSAVNIIFTKIQATRCFNLFRERMVAAMIKEITKLEEGPMPEGGVVTAIDPDILSVEYK